MASLGSRPNPPKPAQPRVNPAQGSQPASAVWASERWGDAAGSWAAASEALLEALAAQARAVFPAAVFLRGLRQATVAATLPALRP